MISPQHVQRMARYNSWQNESLFAAAATLSDAARRKDRGAFFGSIMGTLNHVLWGDMMWMHRFASTPKPSQPTIPTSPALFEAWDDLVVARSAFDRTILDWADALTPQALKGDLEWVSQTSGRHTVKPRWECVAHFFNHQTHHRGQVHAMLTAAGAVPGDTDLFLLPEVAL
ncbi:MAG: DinB family protein [Pseudomonadota bacterium]